MEQYDYIIIGGGCAGLSLAFQMKKRGFVGKKILILEETRKNKNDRSWCFWSHDKPNFEKLPIKSWDKLAFRKDDFEQIEESQELKYHYIKGSEFYEEMHRVILEDPMFEYRHERVKKIVSLETGVCVTTQEQTYHAAWAFNSIPEKPELKEKDIWLKQHFVGYFLETEAQVFTPEVVTFMDFSTAHSNAFMYILPFSATYALVEFTVFSENEWDQTLYAEEIKKYMRTKLGVDSFTIKEVEKGSIPMTSFKFPRMDSKRVVNIGTRGGMTKPTTGYTFLRIQDDSQKIVDQLIQTGSPVYTSTQKKRFRFYDSLLLDIIKNEPKNLKPIMTMLFKRNKISKILTFLDEKTTLVEELKILLRLPWLPFFRAIYRFYIHGKITSTHQPGSSLIKPSYPIPQPGRISPID